MPLLAGGTGFFLRAVLEPIFQEPAIDDDRRDRLRAYLDRQDRATLARWAHALDPARAALAEAGGPQRLSRTLEVALLTGRALTWWHEVAPPDGPPVPCLVAVLELPREELDRRIDARVSRMVEAGLIDEVRGLLARGYAVDAPGMTGTGYREVAAYLAGETTLDEALDEMRRQTRRYARRQLTWFRNQMPADTLRVDARLPLHEKAALIEKAWRQRRGEGTP